MSPDITFEESAVEDLLSQFNKTDDDEGFIVEDSKEQERVLTPSGEEIRAEELGGIASGSEIFIEDNFVSILDFVKRKTE
ncbi:MAG: hypothetical protein ABEJ72_01865 [Candidatus Aenigmatarchaeota archaeon]